MDAVESKAGAGGQASATAAERRDRALRRIFIGLFALLVICFVITELNPSCMWQKVQDQRRRLAGLGRRPLGSRPSSLFFLVYATFTALPLPVVTVMCLLAGALFGRTAGTAVASLGYTAGVTVAFLALRGGSCGTGSAGGSAAAGSAGSSAGWPATGPTTCSPSGSCRRSRTTWSTCSWP